jgi:hypothetical protein
MIDWIAFKDDKPSKEGVAYLYLSRYGGWSKAFWVKDEFRSSSTYPSHSYVDPNYWAEVELP